MSAGEREAQSSSSRFVETDDQHSLPGAAPVLSRRADPEPSGARRAGGSASALAVKALHAEDHGCDRRQRHGRRPSIGGARRSIATASRIGTTIGRYAAPKYWSCVAATCETPGSRPGRTRVRHAEFLAFGGDQRRGVRSCSGRRIFRGPSLEDDERRRRRASAAWCTQDGRAAGPPSAPAQEQVRRREERAGHARGRAPRCRRGRRAGGMGLNRVVVTRLREAVLRRTPPAALRGAQRRSAARHTSLARSSRASPSLRVSPEATLEQAVGPSGPRLDSGRVSAPPSQTQTPSTPSHPSASHPSARKPLSPPARRGRTSANRHHQQPNCALPAQRARPRVRP